MCTFATRHPRRSAQVDVPLKPRLYRHPHGVCAVDAEYLYPGHAAAHIIEDGGRAAFVDVGTNASVPYLLAALAELGIARAAVDYVLLTHVHLDHAGGAGRLMQELPNAVAVLHPRGAPHMIDPSRLIEGSRAVYGERLEQLYGQLLPIPAARVRVVEDGERVRLGGRTLELIHVPGHALFFFSSRRRHTRCSRDWSSDVCSSDLGGDPLDRTVAGVSGGEDAGHGGLEREGRPIERPSRRMRTVPHDIAPGQDVAVPDRKSVV